jgi:hypothetical protein
MSSIQVVSLVLLVVFVGLYIVRRRKRLGEEDRD